MSIYDVPDFLLWQTLRRLPEYDQGRISLLTSCQHFYCKIIIREVHIKHQISSLYIDPLSQSFLTHDQIIETVKKYSPTAICRGNYQRRVRWYEPNILRSTNPLAQNSIIRPGISDIQVYVYFLKLISSDNPAIDYRKMKQEFKRMLGGNPSEFSITTNKKRKR